MTGGVFIGVDGGKSTVRLRVGGGAEHPDVLRDGVTHGDGDTYATLVATISDAWNEARSSLPDEARIERIALGLTTLPSAAPQRAALAQTIGETLGAAEVWLMGDAIIGHAAAFADRSGVALIVGTGIACLAVDAATGTSLRVDGDGFLLGDNGSAFWIGSRGLAAVLAASDGRGPHTALTASSEVLYGEHADLASHVHSIPRPVNAVAAFAEQVQLAAGAGDEVASAIVRGAAAELMKTALAAANIFDGSPVPLAITGRAVSAGTPLRTALLESIAAEPRLAPVTTTSAPVEGALAIAESGLITPYGSYITEWSGQVTPTDDSATNTADWRIHS